MQRNSRVSEHFDTKSLIKLASPALHDIVILEKRRPFGVSNNIRAAYRTLPVKERDPVSLGEFGGTSHSSVTWPKVSGARIERFSREGKEQIRLRTSWCGVEE